MWLKTEWKKINWQIRYYGSFTCYKFCLPSIWGDSSNGMKCYVHYSERQSVIKINRLLSTHSDITIWAMNFHNSTVSSCSAQQALHVSWCKWSPLSHESFYGMVTCLVEISLTYPYFWVDKLAKLLQHNISQVLCFIVQLLIHEDNVPESMTEQNHVHKTLWCKEI
jgi:hypothetical protein